MGRASRLLDRARGVISEELSQDLDQDEGLDSVALAGMLVLMLFNERTNAHRIHLNTKSQVVHDVTKKVYEELPDLADRFAEPYHPPVQHHYVQVEGFSCHP